jgi:phosphatidate cytidylyltransferase
MLVQRFISGLLAASGAGVFVWLGGFPFLVLISSAVWIGADEYYRLVARNRCKPMRGLLLTGAVAIPILAHIFGPEYLGAAAVAALIVPALFTLFYYGKYTVIDAITTTYGILYVGLLFSFLILLRRLPGGIGLVALALVATWACDITAYFVGVNFGRRKLCPPISPNKTVAGAWGGLAGSIAGLTAVGLYLHLPILHLLLLGTVTGLAAEVGDLVESALKRYAGAKDSGRLLPGHGGILDRCDSLIFAAPVVYYYLTAFIIN